MYNYRLLNASGDLLGVVSLETEDLPKLLMAGEKFILGGSYVKQAIPPLGTKDEFIEFFVYPEPVMQRQD